jgi:hypothetical protein
VFPNSPKIVNYDSNKKYFYREYFLDKNCKRDCPARLQGGKNGFNLQISQDERLTGFFFKIHRGCPVLAVLPGLL